jgi:hypothetical protein
MDESKFTSWIKKVYATEEEEISCSACFDLVSTYVDAEIAGAEIQGVLRKVSQHLDQCKTCQDEYELLRELVSLEADLSPADSSEPGR